MGSLTLFSVNNGLFIYKSKSVPPGPSTFFAVVGSVFFSFSFENIQWFGMSREEAAEQQAACTLPCLRRPRAEPCWQAERAWDRGGVAAALRS